MKKTKLGKDVLTLAIFTLLTALTWVGFAVWSAATKTTISEVTKEQIAPLNPQIKKDIFTDLKNKTSFSPEEIDKLRQSSVSSPSAKPEELKTEEIKLPSVATETGQTATEGAIVE